ncbi:DUF3253 domain-containing protein [uncultured Algoriphagus sp.]|uniref:DUF3253 domain-containing protein n=1 Tax=uncultured Algoriphagus sp. TaxID=417365 RepID=UPI001065EE36|nr:DUF3253 domain-containing protein [uncultured Algoriphagus sp.]
MDILRIAILEFCRQRPDTSFCPSEVVRRMYPESWSEFLPDIRQKAFEMYQEGEILITQKGKLLDKEALPVGPIRISKLK